MPSPDSIRTFAWSSQPYPALRASEMGKHAADKSHPENCRNEDHTNQGQRVHLSPPRATLWDGTQPARLFWSLIQGACLKDLRFVPAPEVAPTKGALRGWD